MKNARGVDRGGKGEECPGVDREGRVKNHRGVYREEEEREG